MGRKPKNEVVIMHDGRAYKMPRAGNIKELSATWIGLANQWALENGEHAFKFMWEKYPDKLFELLFKAVSVVRIDQRIEHATAPKSEDQILQTLQSRIGPEGVKEWLKFKERVKALENKQQDASPIGNGIIDPQEDGGDTE